MPAQTEEQHRQKTVAKGDDRGAQAVGQVGSSFDNGMAASRYLAARNGGSFFGVANADNNGMDIQLPVWTKP